ncbi:MAG: tetratricopeptide repeat protein [Candidatus Rokuibacteriota bacterium]
MRIVTMGIGLLMTALAGPGWAQFVDEAQKCFDPSPRPPEMSIRFCTNAIESKRTTEAGRAVAFANRGHAYLAKGQLEQAIQDYTQSLRLGPDTGGIRVNRGVAYLRRGQDDRALEDFNEVLRITPGDPSAHYHRGLLAWRRGEVERALRDYDDAIRLDSRLAAAYSARGDVHKVRGDRDRAIQDYDLALKLDPSDRNAYVGRGLSRFDHGQLAEAITDLVRATELDPDAIEPALYLYLSREHLRQDGRPALTAAARRDLSRWPGPVVAMYLGRLKPKDLLAAIPQGASTAQRTQRCQAYFYLGQEMLLRGDSVEAARMFKEAVATAVAGVDEYESARAYLARRTR